MTIKTEGTPDATTFDDAFAAASAAGGELPVEAVAPVADAAPAGDTTGTADPAAAAPAGGGDAAPAGGEPAAADLAPAGGEAAPAAAAPEAPAAPADANAAPAPSADEIVKGLADLIKQGQQPQQAEQPAQQPAQQAIYTPDEVTILEDYEKNWPDVAQAEALRRKAEYHDMMKYIFEQVAAFVTPTIEQVRAIQNNLHTGELKTLVPDYDPQLEEKINGWIETQPNYLQMGMKHVMTQGTSEEVADLIGRFRAATGSSAPAAQAAPAPAPAAAPQAELSSATKQAVASLAPVSGERSAVPQGDESAQDYDSAFKRFAASGDLPKF